MAVERKALLLGHFAITATTFTGYGSLPLIIAIWQVQKYRNTNNSIPGVICTKDKGPGNTDMYGLGVRIAAYIQVLIGLAATTPGANRAALIGNIAFLSAFTTAVWVMLRNPNTDTLDLYVVIVLGNGLTMLMCDFSTMLYASQGVLRSFIPRSRLVWLQTRSRQLVLSVVGTLDDYYTADIRFNLRNLRTLRNQTRTSTLRTLLDWLASHERARLDCYWLTSHVQHTFTVLLSAPGTSTKFKTVFMTWCQLLVLGLWKACTTLFWWKTLPATVPQPGCEIYGYLFFRAILEPGAPLHTFHKALNIVGWVYWFICVTIFLLNFYRLVRLVFWGGLPTGQKHSPPRNKLRILFDLTIVFPSLQQINEASIMEAYRDASSPVVDFPDNGSPGGDTPGSPDEDTPDEGSPDRDAPAGFRAGTRQKIRRFLLVITWFVTAGYYLITPVEFIIAANRIPGVNVVMQTGQLLPLVASICILCAFSMDLCIEVLKKQGKEESNGGGGTNSPSVIQDSQISGGLNGETEAPIRPVHGVLSRCPLGCPFVGGPSGCPFSLAA